MIIQAYTLYEEQAGDTRAQCASLTLLIGTLEKVSRFGEENHSTLRQSLTQAATRLLKRPDQVRTLLLCTHLFWSAQRINENTQEPEPVRKFKNYAVIVFLNNRIYIFRFVIMKKLQLV